MLHCIINMNKSKGINLIFYVILLIGNITTTIRYGMNVVSVIAIVACALAILFNVIFNEN